MTATATVIPLNCKNGLSHLRITKIERDLYHIETDRKGGYIEFVARQIYRAKHIDKKLFMSVNAVLVKKLWFLGTDKNKISEV